MNPTPTPAQQASAEAALNLPKDTLAGTKEWFNRAVPTPTEKNQMVQLGVHVEEFNEMLDVLKSDSAIGTNMLTELRAVTSLFAKGLKGGVFAVQITDRKEFLDALVDQIVTATGCGHMNNMQVPAALYRVNLSNFSKFDENGNPIFDENGKIAKNKATYYKPDLSGLY